MHHQAIHCPGQSAVRAPACARITKPVLGARSVYLNRSRRPRVRTNALFGGTRVLGGTQRLKPSDGQPPNTGLGGLFGTIQTAVAPKVASKTPKETGTVFVAGATGRTGARIVRELLAAGFKVRAGVRDVESAQQSVDLAVKYGLFKPEYAQKISLVPFDLGDTNSIAPAIGGAGVVVCAVGAAEELSFSAPQKVDGEGTVNLIETAAKAGVERFVLVSSLGTGKVGFPAAVLNLFGGILYWKRQAEVALERSGMSYTIVRPGGMERPTDSYKKTHNLVVKPRDTLFGGNVSRLQVAELVAASLSNLELSENKVLEVVAETTAPLLPPEELLASLSRDISREDQLTAKTAVDEARQEVEAAQSRVAAAAAALSAVDEEAREVAARLKELVTEEKDVRRDAAAVLKAGRTAEREVQAARAAAEQAAREEAAARAVLDATRKAAQAGELLDERQRNAVAAEVLNPKPAAAAAPAKEAPAPLFGGGLFGAQKPAVPVEGAAEEEEEEEEEKPAPRAAPSLFGFFGARTVTVADNKVVEEEEEEEEVVEQPPQAAPRPGLFSNLFAPRAPQPGEPEVLIVVDAEAEKPAAKISKIDEAKARAKAKEEALAKAKAESAAQAREALEAKAKATAEAKAKAEAQAKAAADARAKADAEAKAQAEARAKAEQAAKDKAEADAKAAAAAAEAKAKADAQAKKAAEAEAAQRQAEAEARRVEAERKQRQEEEAALAAMRAEKEAAATAAAAAKAKAEAEALAASKAEMAAKAKAAGQLPPSTNVPDNVADARKWISNWRAKQRR